MRDFKAPDDHPTPQLDFVSLAGRAAIRASLAAHHPEIVQACADFGPADEVEVANHAKHVEVVAQMTADLPPAEGEAAPVAETIEEFTLTDRYWHGMHRLVRPAKETP